MISVIELVDKDIKTIIATIFYIQYEEVRRKNEYVKQKHGRHRAHVQHLGLKNYNIKDKQYTRWG